MAFVDEGPFVSPTVMATGMTLRDHFAAQAMASVDRNQWLAFCMDAPQSNRTAFDECAAWCGQMADAMLAERNK